MLPFPRMVEYGNIAPTTHWYDEYDGSLLAAYDSKNFSQSGFTDYAGASQTVINNVLGTVGSYPTIYNDTTFQYGTGIKMNFRGATYTTAIPAATWVGAWTVDYWHRLDTVLTNNYHANMCYLFVNANIINGTNYTQRLLVQQDNDRSLYLSLWNNAATPPRTATSRNDEVISTTWHHIALVYNGSGTFRFFINGILKQTFTYSILNPVSLQTGIYGYQFINGNNHVSCIERFRIRKKAVWTDNFDTNTIYS